MHYIIGIDEAWRGPWAWPVVAGGFMCAIDFDFWVFAPYLTDSKAMSERDRDHVFAMIEKVMEEDICRYHFAYRDASYIDGVWIREANRQCMEEVILSLLQYRDPSDTISIYIDGCDNYTFCIDGFEYIFAKKKSRRSIEKNGNNSCHSAGIHFSCTHENQASLCTKDDFKRDSSASFAVTKENNSLTYLIGGDVLSPIISAASVVAKVTRDKMLCDFHEDFPEYGFDSHKGYGTSKHRDALIHYGITPIHRKSYEPMKSLILEESSI